MNKIHLMRIKSTLNTIGINSWTGNFDVVKNMYNQEMVTNIHSKEGR